MRRIARFRGIVHGSFATTHNLKVTGSNPVPATKIFFVIKCLRAALRGGVCVSNTRGSTVEARGRARLQKNAQCEWRLDLPKSSLVLLEARRARCPEPNEQTSSIAMRGSGRGSQLTKPLIYGQETLPNAPRCAFKGNATPGFFLLNGCSCDFGIAAESQNPRCYRCDL